MMAERWWTAPAEAPSGKTVIVTGHDYLDKIREKGKHPFRVEVTWDYEPQPDGMPSEADAQLMESATEALREELRKDKAACMTGIYTGDGSRDWVFYTSSLAIFGKILNRALEKLDPIPLRIEAYSDPDWEEYAAMRESSYIPETDEES